MAERRHPSRRPGPEPVASSTTSTTDLVERLTSGDRDAAGPLCEQLTGPLARLAAALGVDLDHGEAATRAVGGAAARAADDPSGEGALWGGRWDAVAFGGLALLGLLEHIGRPARLSSERLSGLSLQQRVLLLLVEVELLTPDEVAGLFDAPLTDVQDHLRRLHLTLQLPPPPASPCREWDTVRVHHRLEGQELEDADRHLDDCDACGEAFEMLEERRGDLVRNVPGIGWTQLGRAFAAIG